MENALVVCSANKGFAFYERFLRDADCASVYPADNGASARRLFIDNDFELVIVHCPLVDEYGADVAIAATERTTAGVVLVVKADMADGVASRVEDCGVITVEWPTNRSMLHQAVKIAAASRKRMLGLKSQNIELQRKLEDMRYIDRAKCALIQSLHLTEPQAHRYIEKQAMDRRSSKRAVAEAILRTYET